MKRTIAALAFAAAISAATAGAATTAAAAPSAHVPAGHHYGWQHNPRNPHYVKLWRPPVPSPTCTWVISGAVGSVPRCV
jgi:hypothetical protein